MHTLLQRRESIHSILEEMAKSSTKFCCEDIFSDAKPRTFKQVYGRNLSMIN